MSKVPGLLRIRVSAVTAEEEAAGFYTPSEAARLARVPGHRLRAWKRKGIIFPTVTATDFDGRMSEGYTYEAVVYLRLLRMLRTRLFPLFKAVTALKHLHDRFGPPGPHWEQARFFVAGDDVWVDEKTERDVTAAVLLDKEFAQLRHRADALLVPREYQPFVQVDPTIRAGRPVVRGTTLPTSVLYAMKQQGGSLRDIRAAYPWLSLGQVRVAITFETWLDTEAV